MKEHPILFSGPMVRAILAGKKTQTRRVIKHQPDALREYGGLIPEGHVFCPIGDNDAGLGMRDPIFLDCPYGAIGDRLWVRETFSATYGSPEHHSSDVKKSDRTKDNLRDLLFSADFAGSTPKSIKGIWIPSIFMPRWASRITLEVTDIRVERLQEIGEEDATREGFGCGTYTCDFTEKARPEFRDLWEKLNKPRGYGWDANPWVWVVSFKRINNENN